MPKRRVVGLEEKVVAVDKEEEESMPLIGQLKGPYKN
jgi:hypothetical protein